MRIQFSDSSNKTGLVELLARATGTQDATSASYPLKQKTIDINLAIDDYIRVAKLAAPQIKLDDFNFTGEPIYNQNLSSGTGTYTLGSASLDSESAEIQGIDRVEIEMPNGTIRRLTEFNPQDVGSAVGENDSLASLEAQSGQPIRYRRYGNKIVVSPKPNYTTSTGTGLRVYHDRGPSYFVSTDTTKYPGINSQFHKYLYIKPAYDWVLWKKGGAAASGLRIQLKEIEADITNYFKALYNKDATSKEGKRMKVKQRSNK